MYVGDEDSCSRSPSCMGAEDRGADGVVVFRASRESQRSCTKMGWLVRCAVEVEHALPKYDSTTCISLSLATTTVRTDENCTNYTLELACTLFRIARSRLDSFQVKPVP